VAQYQSSGREREVEELTEDGEVEADGEGEMELDETEGIGEETRYLEDHEEDVIALSILITDKLYIWGW